jgi:VanZ family protein
MNQKNPENPVNPVSAFFSLLPSVTKNVLADGRKKSKAWCGRGLAISCVAIAIVSVLPYGRDVQSVTVCSIGVDKILHFLGFAVVSLLAVGAGKGRPLWKRGALVLLVLVFGGAVEWVQRFLPYRTFNPVDMVANALGGLVGVTTGIVILQNRRRRAKDA